MIQNAIERQDKALQLSCLVLRDTGFIKVEIGLEVAAPALLTFWNIPLLEILIRESNAIYFHKFPDLVHENSS